MFDVDRIIAQCRKIAAIFDETMPDTALDSAGHRRGGVNPYYNRTTSGLYLEFYYGYPSHLWTPGGKWSMAGSTYTPAYTRKEDVVAPFMARVQTELYEAETASRWGHYGPVYAIHAIDGEPTDPPGLVEKFVNANFTETTEIWAALADGWTDKQRGESPDGARHR